ncbi:unnamed protein product, partial [Dovyalis caffra]
FVRAKNYSYKLLYSQNDKNTITPGQTLTATAKAIISRSQPTPPEFPKAKNKTPVLL